jgi:hypothetical protein
MSKSSDKKNTEQSPPETATFKFDKLSGGTEASNIWNEIKDKNIDMFALPNQKVCQYCEPIMIDPDKLYLRTTSSSVLPALESACGKNFLVELTDRYVRVSRVINTTL